MCATLGAAYSQDDEIGKAARILAGVDDEDDEGGGLDLCDSLGLSGLTISSDTNTLQISGRVDYEFQWGDYQPPSAAGGPKPNRGTVAGLSDDEPLNYEACGRKSYWLNEDILLSNIRISVNPGIVLTAPNPYGLLEKFDGEWTTPGYTTDVNYRGFSVGAKVDMLIQYRGMTPFEYSTSIEGGQVTGTGSTGPLTIPGTNAGIPVGGTIGTTSTNDVDGTTIDIQRNFFGMGMEARIPMTGGLGSHGDIDYAYTGYFILGDRFGAINETQKVNIELNTGTVNYGTTFNGGYFGLYGGVGVDKTIKLPNNDMYIGASLDLTGGFDAHTYSIVDRVDGTAPGLPTAESTNTATNFVPTAKLGASVYLGSGNMYFGVNGGISTGLYPQIEADRGLSSDDGETGFNLRRGAAAYAELGLRFIY
jgi:hypothetical protein